MVNDELTSTEMNIIDSMFGRPPEKGNNSEDWYEVFRSPNVVDDHYEIKGIDGKALAIISFEDIDIKDNSYKDHRNALLAVFGGISITPSKWDFKPIDD